MTPAAFRQLPLSRLGHLIPPLVDGQALVALVSVTADRAWGAKAAWDIARIAAHDGRRVALVDLRLDAPSLHETVGLEPDDGIVDAFEYGVSLAKAARQVDGVFFIPAGSVTARPGELYAHVRWRKLHAGFRAEGALLLLHVSPAGFGQLAAIPDGAIVLAPEGLDPASAAGQEVVAGMERGTPLLGVARDRWMPAPRPAAPPPPRPSSTRRRTRGIVATLGLAALAVGGGGWALLAGAPGSSPGPAAEPTAVPPAPPAPPAHDTLGWTIQLAAYGTLEKALAHADRLADERGVGGFVTPVPQGDAGSVWYRVLAGSYATRAAAAEARAALWRQGAAPHGIGDLVHAPWSLAPDTAASVDTLRARGLPAVRSSALLGAFETPEQAAFTQAALTRAGLRATLLPRLGHP